MRHGSIVWSYVKAKPIFVLMIVFTSEYETSFLSLILERNIYIDFDADRPASPVHEKFKVEVMAF